LEFMENARVNAPLFRDVAGYEFSEYAVDGATAKTSGYIKYEAGGRSRAQASFVMDGGQWSIELLTVIYE